MKPQITELASVVKKAGAKDVVRVVESIRLTVLAGTPIDVAIDYIKRNQPQLFWRRK